MLTAALLALLMLASVSARAAGPNAVENLPGCTANQFAANDDGSVDNVAIGFTANFYGTNYTTLFLNNNGNVTFDNPLSTYTPFDFTTSGNVMVAPYLADVDTRGAGSGIVTYGNDTLADGTKYFCANWVNVGYYDEHADKTNSFQLLLTQTPAQAVTGNFDITFNYDQVTWETGDASGGVNGFGGTPAAVGYSAGDGVQGHYYVQPGSFTSGSLEDNNGATGLVNNSLNSGGQLGRYVFAIVNGPVSGGTLTGTVRHNGGGTAVGAPVDICPTAGGPCFTRATNSSGVYRAGGLPAGNYNVTAYPPSGDDESSATVGPENVINQQTTNADVTLGPNPNAPPDGTTVTGPFTNPDGIPVINWQETGTLTTLACGGASLSWQMLFNGAPIAGGPMTQVTPTSATDGSATYQASYPAVYPNHGEAHIKITGTCPVGGSTVDTEFDIYIDPSGKVVDTNGNPISNATVTLFRSDSPSGPFIQIPNASAEMSPANRRNPDTTGADGSFGWDVVSGYYEIQATKSGCTSATNHANPVATSSVLSVPPPAANLQIRMFCGETSPAPTPTPPAPVTTTAAPVVTPASVLAEVAASLSSQLHSLLAQLKTKLTNANVKRFQVTLNAVAPGVLTLTVKTVVAVKADVAAKKKGHKPKKPKTKTIVVATGRLVVTAAGTKKVTLTVTKAGRALLAQAAKAHRQLTMTVSEAFAPRFNGALLAAVRPTGKFSVKPHHPVKKPNKKHK